MPDDPRDLESLQSQLDRFGPCLNQNSSETDSSAEETKREI